jgi:hypothetical protein
LPKANTLSAKAEVSVFAFGLFCFWERGQMTISPPAKISCEDSGEFKALASGIDSLVLSIDIEWNEENLFSYLDELKAQAKENNKEQAGVINIANAGEWPFHIKPHGARGYEWLISGNGFDLRIGNWPSPMSRPSAIVEIRSHALWEISPEGAVLILRGILEGCGARLILMKPSRVDLCVDLLAPPEMWTRELVDYKVTRARELAIYYHHKDMTGIGVGRGKISARLYDKPLEICQKSKKIWMYDIWKIGEVPKGKKIIRVEFQLRREVLKELNLETVTELFQKLGNTWAHCSQKWLKFCDRPGLQSHQRKTLPFWVAVQEGFKGAQGAEPLVRVKSLSAKKKHLSQQTIGLLTSVMAVQHEENDMRLDYDATLIGALDTLFESTKGEGDFQQEFAEKVRQKRVKHHRINEKAEEGYKKRRELGFPVGKNHIKTHQK